MNIICEVLILILEIYIIPERLQDVTSFFNNKTISRQKLVDCLPRKYNVIFQLRHSYAKGPFCVTRLISNAENEFVKGKLCAPVIRVQYPKCTFGPWC